MRRERAFRMLAVALAVAFALAAAEGLLRLGDPAGAGAGGRSVPVVQPRERSPRAAPDFRERRAPAAKPPGVFRLVVLGDSYTWGAGVYPEDAYPARLERRLAALAPGTPIEVVSWSRPGWNTRLEVGSLAPALDGLDADALVLGYCLNDLEPTARDELAALQREKLSGVLAPPPGSAGGSRLVGRLAAAWRNYSSRRAVRDYYRSLYDPGAEGRQDGFAALAQLTALAGSRSLPLMMAVFPIFDSPMDSAYPYRDLHREVLLEAQRIGLPAVDLLPCYAGIDSHRLAVVPFTDPHPNELAHRIAADRILDFLVRQRWVPIAEDGLARYLATRRDTGRPAGCGARDGIVPSPAAAALPPALRPRTDRETSE